MSARVRANRLNARRSIGPKTAAGKQKVARNALQHRLAVAVDRDPTLVLEIERLARKIAGDATDDFRRELAYRVSEAQMI
ncbi:MAG: hypothetical protein F9K41_17500 [Sphingopyxis terrae]|nr:MAG: hypothetical protein F9K41_17500 [Sphingopyxis terrae]PWB83553.1 MAG: hypothetical protein C3F11_05905 [Methylocystaceae bacterium]